MKKIYFLLSAAFVLMLMSASDGAGLGQERDRSGSPDGDAVCSACHSAGNFSPSIDLVITDSEGTEITAYVPNETYTLTYTVSGTGATEYGFQSTILDTNLENAGELVNAGSNVQFYTVNNANVTDRNVVEHSSPSASGVFTTDWIAPDAGTSELTIYYSGVATNDNSQSSGDGFAGDFTIFPESFIDNVEEKENNLRVISTGSEFTLVADNDILIDELLVYDLSGRLLIKENNIETPANISLDQLAVGVNVIKVTMEDSTTSLKLMN